MEKIITVAALDEAILSLKMRQAVEGTLLKEEFHATYERLKPANMLKNIFRKTVTSPEVKDFVIHKTKDFVINKAVDVALVFVTGIILRKTRSSFIKRTIGTALVWGIKNLVTRNPAIVKKATTGIIKIIANIITKRKR